MTKLRIKRLTKKFLEPVAKNRTFINQNDQQRVVCTRQYTGMDND
ncbi:MAG: hypothetical protein AB8B61_02495 [Cyclobacteriaceae bacterium]